MRILTNSECKRWVKSQGMVYEPFRRHAPITAQFAIENTAVGTEKVLRAIDAVCQPSGQVLAVVDEHPLTKEERVARFTALRLSLGESRSIEDAPGHLLRKRDGAVLKELLEISVGPGSWSSMYLYLSPAHTTMLLWESSVVDLWSARDSDFELLSRELKPSAGT